ncbi:class I adenylate-forming enzyme family protein [Pseudarthrobacter sulfonivorans]|uniref:class I adenylate-forming enzyme family protein n=1 Tax=Pseudarthrobacter sulfonivorans TaxID=121292 RepID=UPI00168B6A79|nr:class I adenylate-forming enzyme family protein [Pseudarthrobacter sulfonivorans]
MEDRHEYGSHETPRWSRHAVPAPAGKPYKRVYEHRPSSMGELLLEMRRWSDREILVQGDRRLQTREFEQLVAAAAQRMRDRGVGPGDRVMLLGFNSIEWVCAFWALQSLGAVAALGNAWWSREEINGAISLLSPKIVIANNNFGLAGSVPFSELFESSDLEPAGELTITHVNEDDPALVLFSSGTTGSPKGVLMSQRAVVGNLQNLLVLTGRLPNELPAEHVGTRNLLTVPLFHGAGVQTMCSTFLQGGTVTLLRGKFDAGEVLDLIESERITVWGGIPTMVIRALEHPRMATADVSSVKSIPLGGAAVSAELRARIPKAFPGVKKKVGSLYGLTEAGGILASGTGSDISDHPGRVGKPLPVVEIRIDKRDAGGIGEISARTPTVPDGYLGEGPIADPEGWVASGDLGRVDEDGWLYVVGRSKEIIIRGGENIASANVERCLTSHPGVGEAAVIALPHAELGEEVGAAVLLRPEADAVTESDLTAFAREHLANYEVPTRWWFRSTPLPLNAMGKVARKVLLEEWPTENAERPRLEEAAAPGAGGR